MGALEGAIAPTAPENALFLDKSIDLYSKS
jgi:hypothetical protein